MKQLTLPPAPQSLSGPVKAWSEPVFIDTYLPSLPDKNPMFLEKRVYQGSSGKVYPLPVIDSVSTSAVARSWQALHIENEFIRLMILPEIGGRIHVGVDKTNGYDFFYRQNVIKPALVGLAGPWISGGVEFNWPQHHRPATFMPVEWSIEEAPDGSRTVWLGDHDPLSHLKGMHGVCLRPGVARMELRVRLTNRTLIPQSFLWWANVGVHVHEHYQSFFPPDVHFVADHARRAISEYPLCTGHYYGVNYGQRVKNGIPDDQRPSVYPPSSQYPPNDLSWYANIPVPTSYMAVGSQYDFSGGYDHRAQAGLVSVADHHIAPGKKQWTWGNSDFGHAWNRHLTDSDGPYIELMTGVFTDNQPDFSFLAPGETRRFVQYWYPIKKIGPPVAANEHAAVHISAQRDGILIGVAVVEAQGELELELLSGGRQVLCRKLSARPASPWVEQTSLASSLLSQAWGMRLTHADGRVLLSYDAPSPTPASSPSIATEPPAPEKVATNDELYVIGMHLDQYRHATRYPETYWREALRRDAGDCRCLNAMGLWHLKRGEFADAAGHFQRAIRRLTRFNNNPYDGEPYYHLGLALTYLARPDDAYDAFFKATWNRAWTGPAQLEMARIASARGQWHTALQHCDGALRSEPENIAALCLKVLMLRKLDHSAEASHCLHLALELDPLDALARYLATESSLLPINVRLDAAHDLARAGLFHESLQLLDRGPSHEEYGAEAIWLYTRAYFHQRAGMKVQATELFARAAATGVDWCFPSRLEEIAVLQAAISAAPGDGAARLLLGNLYYDRKRHQEAAQLWEQSATLRPQDALVWRNLGIARCNVQHDAAAARQAYRRARECDPDDARVFFEADQLAKAVGVPISQRLADMESHRDLVAKRDDLSLEYISLLNQAGRWHEALEMLLQRDFQPWEGGEGQVLAQFVRARVLAGEELLESGQPQLAMEAFSSTLRPPENLGETWHPLANRSEAYFWLGEASCAMNHKQEADQWWAKAAEAKGDFQQMAPTPYSEITLYQIFSLQRLNRHSQAADLIKEVTAYADNLLTSTARIDYFATSLPTLLLFDIDLQAEQTQKAMYLKAQMLMASGRYDAAITELTDILRQNPAHSGANDLKVAIRFLRRGDHLRVRSVDKVVVGGEG